MFGMCLKLTQWLMIMIFIKRQTFCCWVFTSLKSLLTLSRMGIFGAAQKSSGYSSSLKWIFSLSKICHTYPTMMKLDTVISYLKKIKKIYESRDTPPELC